MYLYVDTCAEAREQPRVLLFRLDALVFLTRSLSLSWNFFSKQGWLGPASPRAPPDHISMCWDDQRGPSHPAFCYVGSGD